MTMREIQEEIITECSTLTDRIEIYDYLISWGDRLEQMDERYRTEDHSVPGCQASTWVQVDKRDGLIHCSADSEARINKGMLALVLRVINDQDPRDILQNDLFFIDRIGLRSHLSPARSHGFNSMLMLIMDRIGEHVAVNHHAPW